MDDNRDKEMMRNQLIAIVLMVALFFAWMKFFTPPPQKKNIQQPRPQQVQQETAEPETAPAPVPAAAVSPALPPVAPQTDNPAQDEVAITDGNLKLVFTKIGGRLKQATVIEGKDKGQQLVPTTSGTDTDTVYPLGLHFSDESIGDEINRRRFDAEPGPDGKSITFSLTLAGKGILHKRFALSDKRHVLTAQVDYQNTSTESQHWGMDQTPAYSLYWGPNITSNDEKMGVKQAVIWHKDGTVSDLPTAGMTARTGTPFEKAIPSPDWVGVKSTYFLVAFKPEFEASQAVMTGNPKQFRFGIAAPRFELAPGAIQSNSYAIYIGPMERSALRVAWPTLPKALWFFKAPWGFMDWFAKLLLDTLNWFHAYIPNYGLGIIFLTILVRMAMFPLTVKSMKSMKKMQMLGPEMQELKEKYGEDQQEMNRRMMELYRERGVNPLGGCLPMMLQMPVFIALYRMLWQAYELRGAPFISWITDLSQPDQLLHIARLHQLPFLGTFEYLNVLPILMGISMVLSQKLTPVSGPVQNPQQKMMMTIMPVFFSFICYNMASGLNLYILTSTVLGMLQQKFTWVGEVELQPKKKTVVKRQHFYAAAQARKREMAREAKKTRKNKP